MTLQELYDAIGGDYDDVIKRLRNEQVVKKYVLKFLDDITFDNLVKALREKNVSEAFRAVHTIKGTCQNLSFGRLEKSSVILTEVLRAGDLEGAEAPSERVREDYILTVGAIRTYKEELDK